MQTEEQLTAEEQSALEAMEQAPQEETPEPEATEPERNDQEAAPEAEEGEKPEFKSQRAEQQEKPPEGFVPHQAMHAERVRRQEVEKQLNELTERLSKLEKPADEPPQWVDPLVDPEGYRRYDQYQRDQQAKELENLKQAREQEMRANYRAQQAKGYEEQFAQEAPDYYDAARHLQQARYNELQQQGLSDSEIARQLVADVNEIFDAGTRIGMNPAKLVYMQAEARGYTKAQQEQNNEADKVAALAEAQKQTQGLGTSGGKQAGRVTISQMAEMSEKELAEISEDDLRRAMGG